MTAHHPLGPSGGHRWMACPGSVRLCADLPDTSSPYAEEGSKAHRLAELCLRRGMYTNTPPDGPDEANTFPMEMRENVQQYLDFVWSIPGDREVECLVDGSDWVPGCFGTVDCLVLGNRIAHVIDLKYGAGVRVFAENNTQLKLYGLFAYLAYYWLYGIEEWHLTIVQPRLDHIDTWTISTADLLAWGEMVKTAAALAMTPDAPLVPGESQCRFCKAKSICRARADANLALAREEFSAPIPKPDILSFDEIGALLPRLDEVAQWVKDVQDYAFEQARNGIAVPGHKLVYGRANRYWSNKSAVIDLLQARGFERSVFLSETLAGIPAVEKLLGGKRKAAPVIGSLIVQPQGSPTLVPETDPRPALHSVASAAMDFQDAA